MSSFASAYTEDQTSLEMKASQAKALDEILGVLLSAGYFRARVNALTTFDKVVGGLCWCITSSGTAVDVDIFYDDDLALGQKIQLSENIVKVLRTMGCPAPLQAHQISGNDFAAIFPVIRWLVTKVLEYRRITGDYVRVASETAFDQSYVPFAASGDGASVSPAALSAVLRAFADDEATTGGSSSSSTVGGGGKPPAELIARATAGLRTDAEKAGDAFLAEVNARYKPLRKYRRAVGTWRAGLSPEARIQSCLLEFGERTVVKAIAAEEDEKAAGGGGADGGKASASSSGGTTSGARGGGGSAGGASGSSGNEFERKFAAMQKAARAEEDEKRRQAVALEASMLATMTEAKSGTAAVSGSNIGALVGLQAEELRKAAEAYKQKEEELKALAESGDLLANTKHGRAAAHGRRVAALAKRKETAEEGKKEQEDALLAVETELTLLRDALTKAEKYNARATAEIAKLDAQVAALPPAQQAQFRNLVELYTRVSALKESEVSFKASCGAQLQSMQQTLEALKNENSTGATATRIAELEALHAETKIRYDRARAAMAVRAREIARLSRVLDDVPARLELVQYERRFLELFDEVAERLDETRKYYTLYNTLDKKRGFLGKEDSLLTSLADNFVPSMKTPKGTKAYLEQVEGVVKSIEDALAKQTVAAEGKKATRDARAGELQALVEAQRAYYRAVRDMQEAADINEKLQTEVEARNMGSGGNR